MSKVAFSAMLVSLVLALTGFVPIILAEDLNVISKGPAAEVDESNQPPTISLPTNMTIFHGRLYSFTANASDPDGDSLRFTWDWGDERSTVTAAPTATHMYNVGTYMLQVYADDLTGRDGHNVSATTWIKAVCLTPPYAVSDAVNAQTFYYVGQTLTFTGSARDSGGDAMQFDFVFGDGTDVVVNNGATAADVLVTNTAMHVFTNAGTYGYYMTATDGLDTTSSTMGAITVYLNHPPVMPPQTLKMVYQGATVSFSASATDLDGDPLRYTWDFGDGSALVVSRTTTHVFDNAGYYNFTVFVDDQTGIPGHNISSTAQISVAFNLQLSAGWNFVSIPLMGYGYKASTLGLSTGDVVLPWDWYKNKSHLAYIKGISPEANNFNMLPGFGYWIWVAASKNLHLYGYVPTTTQTIPVLANYPGGGWFPVGLNSLKTWHASDIPDMYAGPGTITMVVVYDKTSHAYKSWLVDMPSFNDFLIAPGVGFWIWVTDSGGTLSYAP